MVVVMVGHTHTCLNLVTNYGTRTPVIFFIPVRLLSLSQKSTHQSKTVQLTWAYSVTIGVGA